VERAPGRFLALWTTAALAAVAVLLASTELERFDPTVLLATIALVTLAELVVVYIDVGRAGAAFTLSEAALTGAFLVVAPVHVVAAAAAAMLLAHLPRRLSTDKILFNVSQVTVATTAAALTIQAMPDLGPVIGERSIAAVVLGMGVYAVTNTLAFRALVRRIGGQDGLADFDDQVPLTLASMLGTIAVGIVAAALWVTAAFLIPLLLVPVLAIQVAARSSLAASALVGSVRAERDRLDQVVQGASDGILLLDEHGVVQLWNPAVEALTGVAPEQAIGAPIGDVLTDRVRTDAPAVTDRWLLDDPEVVATGHRRIAARWRHLRGDVRDVQEQHTLLYDSRGNVSGDVVLVRDVTRETELERLRADFVARVSHELRTPLTPIRGFIQLLLRRSDRLTADQQHEVLSSMLERTDRLGEVIEDLLLVTELERGRLDGVVDPHPVALTELVTQLIADVRHRTPDRTIDVDLPDMPARVWADPARLRQALTAVLDNALRYSPEGRPITITAETNGQEVTVHVIDQGPGIPASQRDRIFEHFQRLEDPLTMRTGGVGLGLFIARQLTEAMGGRLELYDASPGHTDLGLSLHVVEETAGDNVE